MNDTAQMAKGMMEAAQKRLLHDYPFHARLLAAWKVEASDIVSTMGVTVSGNGNVLLLYWPGFVVDCTLPELESVFVHEVNHVLFEHVLADPAEFPDDWARVIAEEVTVNEWVAGVLPGCPIVLAQHPELPPDEDTLTRYRRLARPGRRTPPETANRVPNNQGGVPKSSSSVPKNGSAAPKNGSPVPKKDGPISEVAPKPLDDHSHWGLARETEQLSRTVIKVTIADARAAMTAAEWVKVLPVFQDQIDKIGGASVPGAGAEHLMPGVGKMNWRRMLQGYVRQVLTLESSFQRPPRRFPRLVGIVPGKVHRPRGKIMAVIDTSGSISNATLTAISGELKKMSRDCEVVVIECDAAVHEIYRFSKEITGVHGRGGTDLRPPFRKELLQKVRPDVVVYFTDGKGPAPVQPPRVPVIWCLTSGGERPAPWVRVIQMA